VAVLKEPCGNCGAIIDRRTDGYGIDPEKGLLCVQCWKLEHAENGHTQTPWEILTFVTDPNHILIGKGFDVIARLDKDDPLAEGNARLILRDVNVHEDLVAAYGQVEGALLEALLELNDAGLPCPASLGLAVEKLREIIASCSKEADKLVNAKPSAPAGRDSSTPTERQAFTERVCKPRGWDRYDSCVDSPCPYSGVGGCRHPEHPSNKKIV
jgi:hypothetical protein